MPLPDHDKGQKLAESIYVRARKNAMDAINAATSRLDRISEEDAATIKQGLRRVLRLQGLPARQVNKIIDDVFKASRATRVKIIEEAIKDAAKAARDLDKQTFRAVFGEPGDADVPFEEPQSDSPRTKTPLRSLPPASEDDSPETS